MSKKTTPQNKPGDYDWDSDDWDSDDVIWLDLVRVSDRLHRRQRAEARRRAEIRRTLQRVREQSALEYDLDEFDDRLH